MNRVVNKKYHKFHIALTAREILWERRTEFKITEVCTLLTLNIERTISKILMAFSIENYIIKNH